MFGNFDHTSIVRFLETRFGVVSPNVTPWRRAVSGDLTSAFDFSGAGDAAPALPDTAAYKPTDHNRHPSYVPTPPATNTMPTQEKGTRPSRPLGYAGPAGWYRRLAGTTAGPDLHVTVKADGKSPHVQFRIENAGSTDQALTLKDAYGADTRTVSLKAAQVRTVVIATQGGWYDLTITSAALNSQATRSSAANRPRNTLR